MRDDSFTSCTRFRLESSRNAYTTTCSRRHKYVERYFTLIPVQFTPFWQQWHKAVLHCRFPWRSKTVRFHQNLLLQLLLATATVRAIKNIYTYRYHSLFRSCFFCRTLRVQARKEALGSPRIQTQFTGDIFYSVHERVYSHLPRNPTPAGHRLILLAIGNKLPVSHWPEAAGSLTSLVQVTISIWFAARCRYNVGLSRA